MGTQYEGSGLPSRASLVNYTRFWLRIGAHLVAINHTGGIDSAAGIVDGGDFQLGGVEEFEKVLVEFIG